MKYLISIMTDDQEAHDSIHDLLAEYEEDMPSDVELIVLCAHVEPEGEEAEDENVMMPESNLMVPPRNEMN